MQIIHIPCIVQEIQTYKIESIFLNHAVFYEQSSTKYMWKKKYEGVQYTYVVGQLSSRTRHRVLAVAALDKSLSMVE